MPPVLTVLALGCGLTLAGLGLVMLLMRLTMHPRARPTLIWFNRAWPLRPVVLTIGLASGLLLLVPRMDWPMKPPHDGAADDARHRSEDHAASRLSAEPSGAVDPPITRAPTRPLADLPVASSAPGDQSVVRPPPARPVPERVLPSAPPESVNLTGEWTILNTIVETSYPPFQQLQLGFRLHIQQDGQAFYGVGEKQRENGQPIPIAARRPIRLRGSITHGTAVTATYEEEGVSRPITGHFRLHLQDRHRLTGTFDSTAAKARGPSHWIRRSSGVAHASRREQPGRDGGLISPPAQGARSAITEEPQPAPDRQGPVTAQGLRGAGPLGDHAASRTDEPRALGRPGAPMDHRPTQPRRPRLHLGMTQADVRDLLGEPASVEAVAGVVFWHYGTEEHEQDVVFAQGTGQVQGWLGFSRGLTERPVE
jgi:hypothetical protein